MIYEMMELANHGRFWEDRTTTLDLKCITGLFYIVLITGDQKDSHQYQKQNKNHAIIKLKTWYPYMKDEL